MEVMEKSVEATAVAVEQPRAESPDWYELLDQAVQEPGQLADAHRFFHNYSLANRWLASTQLRAMGLPLTPINTFKQWLALERPVKKGEKAAIHLIMPVPVKGKKKGEDGEEEKGHTFTRFMLRRYWFALSQTEHKEGKEYVPEEFTRGIWEFTSALTEHKVTEVKFEFDGVGDTKRMGWASQTCIAVSPLAPHQEFERLRQLARVVMGHLADTPSKAVPVDPELREVEVEAAAYLVAASLGISGLDESRARLQASLAGGARTRIPDKNAHRAFSAADKLINAGYC